MTSRTHHRLGSGIVLVLVGVVASVAIATAAFASKASETPAWKQALIARSDALNRYYGLGEYAGTRTKSIRRSATPAWEQALMARSEALNRYYGLGEYAGTRTKSVRRAVPPAWEKALIARGDALNRLHKLGRYADR